MPAIEELIGSSAVSANDKVEALTQKEVSVPQWSGQHGLEAQYDPKKHPVMNKITYPDEVTDEGITPVSRIAVDLPRLAVKRMTELVCGIPVNRVYRPENEKQKEIAKYIEKILSHNRIDSVNVERLNMLFGGCEFITLWYAVDTQNNLYGFDSPLKLRCRNYSPMQGDVLYPLFDDYGDMVALSIGYTRTTAKRQITYLDAYTATRHIKFIKDGGEWQEVENEAITLGKIPAIYTHRPTPIWEDTAEMVYEMEWALSRNGNYLRKNSKPLFIVFADEVVNYGNEGSENREFRTVMQLPQGATAQYVTWAQAADNLKYYINELRSLFFTQLQLPDWSYEKMSQQALSGESRKQLFIDAQMKVKDESGRLLEAFHREINVIKGFLKLMLPASYHADIDALEVESVITPFSISDSKEMVETLMAATGGEPIMSQREAIEAYGHSNDVDKTLSEIAQQGIADALDFSR